VVASEGSQHVIDGDNISFEVAVGVLQLRVDAEESFDELGQHVLKGATLGSLANEFGALGVLIHGAMAI
ncbi:MAG: hypothetical protein SGPRY_007893, partial [Prymnesium sp.]